MRTRHVLTIAVAGTLLMGAGSGTTLALWRDTATVATSSAQSAAIDVRVNGSTAAAITGPTGLAPGVGRTVTATLQNASPAGASNLRTQLFLDAVTSSQSTWTGVLEVSATTVASAGACTAATSGFKAVGPSYTSTQLTASALAPQQSTVLCLTVRLPGSAPSVTRGRSGSLTVTVRAQQVRP